MSPGLQSLYQTTALLLLKAEAAFLMLLYLNFHRERLKTAKMTSAAFSSKNTVLLESDKNLDHNDTGSCLSCGRLTRESSAAGKAIMGQGRKGTSTDSVAPSQTIRVS